MLKIQQITKDEAREIIDTRRPLGNYMYFDGVWWIGIDNRTGEAWVEEFETEEECIHWLDGGGKDE